jgi:hypothetical protein
VAPVEYNFRTMTELEQAGMSWLGEGSSEQPGYSMFLHDGDEVFHTYSMYARGTEMLGGSYYFLDLTALGRQEDWEEPRGEVGVDPRRQTRLSGVMCSAVRVWNSNVDRRGDPDYPDPIQAKGDRPMTDDP